MLRPPTPFPALLSYMLPTSKFPSLSITLYKVIFITGFPPHFITENTRMAVSEISLVAAEFDDYRIGIDTSITFCLKELRVSCAMGDVCGG